MPPRPDLIELAKERRGQIIVPSGALLGLDAVTAAAEGRIHSVRLITRKPPRSLAGAPYLVAKSISVEGLNAPRLVFSGSARGAAAGLPGNVNVAAVLALAGIGPDRTGAEIWTAPRSSATATRSKWIAIRPAFPSDNPRTGRITALSVLAALRKVTPPL
jgi:aspartate dehydrogenase